MPPDASPDPHALIEHHGDAVWRTVCRLIDDPHDARDCYQDTFLAALRMPNPEAVRNWSALLRRVATCRAMDRLRQRYRRRETGAELDRFVGRGRDGDDPTARLEAMELKSEVREVLASLPPRQAEAFWLRHMEQMSPDEVATQMEVSSANARQLVHRATQALRNKLASPVTYRNSEALTGDQR